MPFDSSAFQELAVSAWPGATAETIETLDAASNYESVEVLARQVSFFAAREAWVHLDFLFEHQTGTCYKAVDVVVWACSFFAYFSFLSYCCGCCLLGVWKKFVPMAQAPCAAPFPPPPPPPPPSSPTMQALPCKPPVVLPSLPSAL